MVQENYDADCKTHNPPCPEFYDSAEAYKCKSTSYFVFSWLNSIVINTSNIAYHVIYRITHFCFSISIRIMQTIISLKIYYSFKKKLLLNYTFEFFFVDQSCYKLVHVQGKPRTQKLPAPPESSRLRSSSNR